MLGAEYRVMRDTSGFREAEAGTEEVDLELLDATLPVFVHWLPLRYVYKPKETWGLYAETIRTLRARASEPCDSLPSPREMSGLERTWILAGPNGLGRKGTRGSLATFARYERRRCRTDAQISATQAFLAARVYEQNRGHLPQRLAELVPDLLDRVPQDAWDGAEIRFAPDTRQVYSAGCDDPSLNWSRLEIPKG